MRHRCVWRSGTLSDLTQQVFCAQRVLRVEEMGLCHHLTLSSLRLIWLEQVRKAEDPSPEKPLLPG